MGRDASWWGKRSKNSVDMRALYSTYCSREHVHTVVLRCARWCGCSWLDLWLLSPWCSIVRSFVLLDGWEEMAVPAISYRSLYPNSDAESWTLSRDRFLESRQSILKKFSILTLDSTKTQSHKPEIHVYGDKRYPIFGKNWKWPSKWPFSLLWWDNKVWKDIELKGLSCDGREIWQTEGRAAQHHLHAGRRIDSASSLDSKASR